MSIVRWGKRQPITDVRLNETVDEVNRLVVLEHARQRHKADDAPFVVDDLNPNGTPNVLTWDEVWRQTSVARVTNPEDETQYVDVDRVDAIAFSTPDGEIILLRLTND